MLYINALPTGHLQFQFIYNFTSLATGGGLYRGRRVEGPCPADHVGLGELGVRARPVTSGGGLYRGRLVEGPCPADYVGLGELGVRARPVVNSSLSPHHRALLLRRGVDCGSEQAECSTGSPSACHQMA
jgi:hypothetical protein